MKSTLLKHKINCENHPSYLKFGEASLRLIGSYQAIIASIFRGVWCWTYGCWLAEGDANLPWFCWAYGVGSGYQSWLGCSSSRASKLAENHPQSRILASSAKFSSRPTWRIHSCDFSEDSGLLSVHWEIRQRSLSHTHAIGWVLINCRILCTDFVGVLSRSTKFLANFFPVIWFTEHQSLAAWTYEKNSQKFRFLLRKHISSEIQILCCSISNSGELIQGFFAGAECLWSEFMRVLVKTNLPWAT
jgi:hypothetical protein